MADDQKPSPAPPDLYERDFLAWTEQQAKLLAAGPAGAPYLDFVNILEEIETLGRSEVRGATSQVTKILEHFLKIEFLGPARVVPHWRGEIRAFRGDLEHYLTATVRKKVQAKLDQAYELAVSRAEVYALHAGIETALPKDCPYTWDQIVDPDWYPQPR